MRCLSPHAKYSINVFDAEEKIVTDPRGYAHAVPVGLRVMANFEQLGLMEHEVEVALSSFTFTGLPEGVNPLARIGVFDTEVYCLKYSESEREAMQAQIEERLRVLQAQTPSDFIIVDTPTAGKPWAKYDDDSVEQILALQQATGTSPDVVLRYEQENQQRKSIIEAMKAQQGDETVEAEEEIVVET